MGAIRGAICAENTESGISGSAVELIEQILLRNNLRSDEVDAIIFSATSDLDACYPAKAVRERFSMSNVAFMCLSEMSVRGSLERCLRACVFTTARSQQDCKHCFLGNAAVLRTDL